MYRIKIQLDSGAIMPTRAYPTDAGLDLYAREDRVLLPGSNALFDTGVHLQLPDGYYGKIESRSGLNVKSDVVSCGGVIDCSYTGSIKVKLYNLGKRTCEIQRGFRIAQLVIMPCETPELDLVEELDETERGNNGFGSTGH